ncbi:MAG TPA: penicillin-binding protein 2 [Nitrospiraceae bacterium]|jgi:penicillin-binding protein 2|nr:penicillin-binding protein 2 [Nitrospiraceae bacterium]
MASIGFQDAELVELQRRLIILRIGLLLVVGLLALRLWHLQIREGPYYRDLSENNRTRSVILEPVRGQIYDRNGELLANNVPSFTLYVTLEDVADREALIEKLTSLLGLDPDVVRRKLAAKNGKLLPRKIKDRLSLREAAVIEAHRLDLPGVMIQVESQRNYPGGTVGAHLLGYVGEISAEQLERAEFEELHQGSIIGQYGVEKTFDRFLRGRAGQKSVEVDALGHEKRSAVVKKPEAGDDLYLTIDIRLQKLAEDLLGEEAGAIVALDPTNGDILAMASRPAFDPNVLSRELTPKQWAEIVQDEGHPLTNRATQGQYPPGSTFKVIMAAAALETKTVSPSTAVRCTGGYQFGRRLYRDWKAGGHGFIDLERALIHSCDVYFYTVGQRMGIDTIADYAKQFGLGQLTGIELPSERVGIVPSTGWKEKVKGEPWLPGETISASIGQGYVTVTPIQMASVIGTIANNGVAYRPRLVQAIMDRATGRLQELPAVARGRVEVKPQTLKLIQEGLAGVVREGTATRARSSLISIAGKTGTAQTAALRTGPEKDIPKKFRDHAWFVAYAPVEKPRIAVAVLVEHMGHGGSAAAPLAKELIEAFVKLPPKAPLVAQGPNAPAASAPGETP